MAKRRLFDPEFVREGAVRTVRETRKPIAQDKYSGRRFQLPAGTCGVSLPWAACTAPELCAWPVSCDLAG
jgi:hypothetical protein